MHKAERCRRESDAVGKSERRNGLRQFPTAARDDDEGEHEQQMVEAGQNVFHAQHGIDPCDLQSTGRGVNYQGWHRLGQTRDLG